MEVVFSALLAWEEAAWSLEDEGLLLSEWLLLFLSHLRTACPGVLLGRGCRLGRGSGSGRGRGGGRGGGRRVSGRLWWRVRARPRRFTFSLTSQPFLYLTLTGRRVHRPSSSKDAG